jgi:hypothetical protein
MPDPKDSRRCRATAKGSGQQCKRRAAPGAVVCVKHGAGAPQVKAAAQRRLAVAAAARMVADAGMDLDPLDHLLGSLYRAYAQMEAWGAMVAEIDERDGLKHHNRFGEQVIHPYVREYNGWVDRRARFAKMCLDAGVAERQVRMVEAQVELAQRAFEAMLGDLDLSDSQRQEARKSYARHLRSVA